MAPTENPGAPVVLFNSLMGCQLECVKSPKSGWADGKLIVMNTAALGQGFVASSSHVKMDADQNASVELNNVFLEHCALDPTTDGEDMKVMGSDGHEAAIEVRPRKGLDAIEYLMDVPLMREQARLLIGLTTALRSKGYSEWDEDNRSGNMLGAAYDWRLNPARMEERDGFMTKLMFQVEAMVAAHPDKTPAAVIGHSMGCKVGKYFLHFCHKEKGKEWMTKHIARFIPLGGPFMGSVSIFRNTAIDGATGEALDMMFSESQLLTLCRTWPRVSFF